MKKLLVPALAALALSCAAGAALAQAQSAPIEGMTVKGANGVVLGVVERIITGSDGRPAQILVRPKGPRPAGPHALAYAAVTIKPDGVTTPITKAEFDAMPSVEVEAK